MKDLRKDPEVGHSREKKFSAYSILLFFFGCKNVELAQEYLTLALSIAYEYDVTQIVSLSFQGKDTTTNVFSTFFV